MEIHKINEDVVENVKRLAEQHNEGLLTTGNFLDCVINSTTQIKRDLPFCQHTEVKGACWVCNLSPDELSNS